MLDYYSILGVPRTATAVQIKEAFQRLARENHPDRFRDPQARERAAVRFQEINESYNHLRDEDLRREYDKSLTRQAMTPQQQAQLYYKNGLMREQIHEYGEALQLFYEAMRLDPEEAQYAAAAARGLARDPSKSRQAAELYEKAIAKDPRAKEPYLELGALLSKAGLAMRARRIYEIGLKWHPDDPELKRQLAGTHSITERTRRK